MTTTTSKSKPTILGRLTAAVTKDGKLLPLSAIANRGLVSLAVGMLALFVAGTLIIILLSNPVTLGLLGGGAAVFLYLKKYGPNLPPQVADALDQRRVAREGSAAPSAAKRAPHSRSDRQLS